MFRLFVLPLALLLAGGAVRCQTTAALSGTYIKGEIGIFDDNAVAFAGSVLVLDSVCFVNTTQKSPVQTTTLLLDQRVAKANHLLPPKPLTLTSVKEKFIQQFITDELSASQQTAETTETQEPAPQRTIVKSVPYHNGASPVTGSTTGGGWAMLRHHDATTFAVATGAGSTYGYFLSHHNHITATPSPPPKKAGV